MNPVCGPPREPRAGHTAARQPAWFNLPKLRPTIAHAHIATPAVIGASAAPAARATAAT